MSNLCPLASDEAKAQECNGQNIQKKNIDRAILILRDMPGLDVQATLKPKSEQKTIDFLIDVKAKKSIETSIGLDNYGLDSRDKIRLNTNINFNSLDNLGTLCKSRGNPRHRQSDDPVNPT
jgi:hemolysin activation/secretion protein